MVLVSIYNLFTIVFVLYMCVCVSVGESVNARMCVCVRVSVCVCACVGESNAGMLSYMFFIVTFSTASCIV